MLSVSKASIRTGITALLLVLSIAVLSPYSYGKDKKKAEPAPTTPESKIKYFYEHADLSKIVWPNPPSIARIRYLNYWSGEKSVAKRAEKKKSSWMERVAGVATGETADSKPRWQLVLPNGVAVDSKGRAYIADSKVRAVFIVDPETGNYEMIKNGVDANFKWLTGLMVDDTDRIFVADSGLHRIVVFGPNRKVESTITEKLADPGNMAIDEENRLLYVTDAEQDLVLVYDADAPHKFLRSIGKPGTNHAATAHGEFAKPTGVAVDQDGNVFVADTWNDRIQVFDAEGNFIRTFGKAGDGPGYFARPKGIAVDGDGHLWVADQVQDRVQVFTPEGHLLIYMGGHGLLPGQFQSVVNITIDKNNRVLTTEQLPGRLQIFRYVNDAEAKAELERRNAEAKAKSEERLKAKSAATEPKLAGAESKQ